MSEAQAKTFYSLAVAILGVLGAYGVVDSIQTTNVLGIVQGGLTFAGMIVPIIAHKRVGFAGVDAPDLSGSVDTTDATATVTPDKGGNAVAE